ncbi:D-serine ammonia-lyase [Aquibacillus halophilus]|uniref:Probable D-serine dehydratase n=1 Tax=Aquibacillus halophilus TaxID=930132 RepID=A0A6A8DBG8_9BACI|nr:D-serine ammonia-lyase [Aquibacillus halophilus]MRH41111.1 D-serine ammonia-lyase [Aquibacillus halophilus]
MEKSIEQWTKEIPELKDVVGLKPIFWQNPHVDIGSLADVAVKKEDILDAMARWERFAPYLSTVFPEIEETGGIIDSPLKKIDSMKKALIKHYDHSFAGDLYLKCDNELPIAGSIKARGGFYEILKYAEKLAIDNDMLSLKDNYQVLSEPRFKEFFSSYSIGVSSTGNLALSIGIISAKLGFNVDVYMSADAKQWKKDLLRTKGVNVFESKGDFSKAVTEGRERTSKDPKAYFVDDENSRDLFLGYSTAALHLKKQLDAKGIAVDENNPLNVYLPCGVGGSPGGITFGLKTLFGSNVHCYLVEPTHTPSVLIGLLTGEHEKVSVSDFGIDGVTEADGLAVGRPSAFATKVIERLVDGIYTIEDDTFFKLLTLIVDSEKMKLEPSATAGLIGPTKLTQQKDLPKQTTHIAWATGGALVPESYMKEAYENGK